MLIIHFIPVFLLSTLSVKQVRCEDVFSVDSNLNENIKSTWGKEEVSLTPQNGFSTHNTESSKTSNSYETKDGEGREIRSAFFMLPKIPPIKKVVRDLARHLGFHPRPRGPYDKHHNCHHPYGHPPPPGPGQGRPPFPPFGQNHGFDFNHNKIGHNGNKFGGPPFHNRPDGSEQGSGPHFPHRGGETHNFPPPGHGTDVHKPDHKFPKPGDNGFLNGNENKGVHNNNPQVNFPSTESGLFSKTYTQTEKVIPITVPNIDNEDDDPVSDFHKQNKNKKDETDLVNHGGNVDLESDFQGGKTERNGNTNIGKDWITTENAEISGRISSTTPLIDVRFKETKM